MNYQCLILLAARWFQPSHVRLNAAFACCLILSAFASFGCSEKESTSDALEAALPAGREVFEGIIERWNNDDTASLVEFINQKSILEDPAAMIESLRTLRQDVGTIRQYAEFKLVHNDGMAGQDGDFIGASTMVAERGAVVLRLGLDQAHAIVHFSITGRQIDSLKPPEPGHPVE